MDWICKDKRFYWKKYTNYSSKFRGAVFRAVINYIEKNIQTLKMLEKNAESEKALARYMRMRMKEEGCLDRIENMYRLWESKGRKRYYGYDKQWLYLNMKEIDYIKIHDILRDKNLNGLLIMIFKDEICGKFSFTDAKKIRTLLNKIRKYYLEYDMLFIDEMNIYKRKGGLIELLKTSVDNKKHIEYM